MSPILAQLVRVIGGPTGPSVGAVGPTGLQGSLTLVGATGGIGPTGMTGLTGPHGRFGLDSTLTGPVGKLGPAGSMGYPGPFGAAGFNGIVPADQFVYFENRTGIVSIPYRGTNANCNFTYTPIHSGILFVAFSGLVRSDDKSISLGFSSDGGFSLPSITIVAPNMAVPFFMAVIGISPLPFDTFTLDVVASYNSTPFDFGPHGSVVNINCVIMEF